LWSRLQATSFLTDDEKRAAIGYGPKPPTAAPAQKFNPYHDDCGRFDFAPDGPAEDEGVDDLNPTLVADSSPPPKYSVDLAEEEGNGGHTVRDHVGKSDDYLLGEVGKVRSRLWIFTTGNKQEGSFLSQESANDFVNRVSEDNQSAVDAVASGEVKQVTLNKRFGYVTGKEGYKPSGLEEPYVRPTYEVRVLIRHDPRAERGYRLTTSFPRNQIRADDR
jgi:Bacterial CdiA-CT RNAse A domain